jgi:hypothetical protein
MDLLRDELFSVPDAGHALAVLVRIVAAGLLGAVIGKKMGQPDHP